MSDWWSSPRQPPGAIPFRNKFDAARDPLTARNAIGAVDSQYVLDAIAAAGGGGGGAPTSAQYVTAAPDATLTDERVLTNTATVTWDFTVPGQAKATAVGGGNVSNSGTPTVGQYAKWVTATTIQGVAPATVLSDIGAQPAGSYQPLDADLTAIAALTGTNTIYYRSAANTWAAVTVGTGLTFAGGTLDRAALTGDVTAAAGGNTTTIASDAVTYAKMQNVSAASLLIGRGSAAGAGDPQEITLGTNLSMSGTTLNATAAGGGTATPAPPQGRLTLQSITPVMTTTLSGRVNIYYTPYVGDRIPIYDGTNMVMTAFTELSVATTDTTKSPAAIGASKVNDWFVWSDAGTLRLGHGPDWTSDTVRSAGTALVRVNGIWLNNAAITNGPAASRGTYVGTTRSNASSQLDWIFGANATGGTAGVLNVWNAYNRVSVATMVGDSTSSYTYSGSFRNANNSATMRVSYVAGLSEDAIDTRYICSVAPGNCTIAIGFDSSTVPSGAEGYAFGGSVQQTPIAMHVAIPSIGAHFVQALEYALSGTTFWASTTGIQNGLFFSFRM